MSVKKLLILTAAGAAFASTAAMAGGAPAGAYSAPARGDYSVGPYVQANIGEAHYGYKDAWGTGTNGNWSRGDWGFAPGLALGYAFNNYLAAELGSFYVWPPKHSDADGSNFKVKTWLAYVAGRLSVPVYTDTQLYTKVGAGYQHVKVDGTSVLVARRSGTEHDWKPFFGLGALYNFTSQVYAGLEWDHFAGDNNNGQIETTNLDNYMLTVGYRFAI